MNYNEELNSNNEELRGILNAVNELPDADGVGGMKFVNITESSGTLTNIAEVLENPEHYAFTVNYYSSLGGAFMLYFEANHGSGLAYSNTVMRDDKMYYLFMAVEKETGIYLTYNILLGNVEKTPEELKSFLYNR